MRHNKIKRACNRIDTLAECEIQTLFKYNTKCTSYEISHTIIYVTALVLTDD